MLLSNNLRTKININTNVFNINNLKDTVNNKSIFIPKTNEDIIEIPKIDLPIRYRFDIIEVNSFNVVYIIENDISFFSVLSYLDMILGSNIKLYISSLEKYEEYLEIFYKNVYSKNNPDFKNIIFTNKLIKNFPVKNININTCYKFSDDFNKSKHYNCFWIKNTNDVKNIEIDEFEYQKFTDYSIIWFLEKVFSNSLIKYSSKNIIIHTDNLKIINGIEYIYIDLQRLTLLEMYFNWFTYSFKINISLKEFILLTLGYYLQNIVNSLNLFINGYISNHTNDNIGLKYENKLCGIQINNKFTGNFEDFVNLMLNKYGSLSKNIENKVSFKSLILVRNINNDIIDDENIISKLIYDPNDIGYLIKTYPYQIIWIFDNLQDYKFLKKHLNNFPDNHIKFQLNKNIVMKITNKSFMDHQYTTVKLNNYILDFTEITNDNNNSQLSSTIQKYNKKVILTVLIPNYDCYNYFTEYYSNMGYHIIFVNLFKIEKPKFPSNCLIVDKLDDLINNNNIIFIRPNYFFEDCLYNNQVSYSVNYYKDIGKKTQYGKILKQSDNKDRKKVYIIDIVLNIYQRIKIEKMYNTILRNEYIGLF